MSYALKIKGTEFDWNKFLSIRKRPSHAKIFEAVKLASSWNTCACGQQSEHLERDFLGIPVDKMLLTKGSRFTAYVAAMYNSKKFSSYERNRLRAKAALKRIEKRSTELLNSN